MCDRRGVLANYDISGGGPIAFAGAEFTAGINPPMSQWHHARRRRPRPQSDEPSGSVCPNTTDPEVLTEEFNGTTMTVMVPPTPIYVPCPTRGP